MLPSEQWHQEPLKEVESLSTNKILWPTAAVGNALVGFVLGRGSVLFWTSPKKGAGDSWRFRLDGRGSLSSPVCRIPQQGGTPQGQAGDCLQSSHVSSQLLHFHPSDMLEHICLAKFPAPHQPCHLSK